MWGGRLARPVTKGGQDFGVSATSLREAAPTTTLSTSQSNAAHPTSSSNLFLGNPLCD
ncbi:MAG: hypothetical protein ACYTX0_09930 [Nostoc sp.]